MQYLMRRIALIALLSVALAPLQPATAAPDAMERALNAYASGDLKAAARGFTALSARQLPLADYNLAMMHLRGELPRPSPREARRLLERAAAQGFVSAEFALGQLHEQGVLGKPDLRLASARSAGC